MSMMVFVVNNQYKIHLLIRDRNDYEDDDDDGDGEEDFFPNRTNNFPIRFFSFSSSSYSSFSWCFKTERPRIFFDSLVFFPSLSLSLSFHTFLFLIFFSFIFTHLFILSSLLLFVVFSLLNSFLQWESYSTHMYSYELKRNAREMEKKIFFFFFSL